ncbi:M13 family metallopeptidase [Sphingomonas sp.]|uniref:M13 family metallopeptidase n=1 Tax=Sphingomonas sp. TaxID=28214 RepID=UPI003B00DC87
MRILPLLATASLLTGTALAAPATKPTYGSFGFDAAGMDRSRSPGDDFYGYANGGWQKATTIPADRASYGMFVKLQDLSLARTRGILDEAAAKPGSRIGDLYASFMDEAAADAKGAAPVKTWLAGIAAAKDKAALAAIMADMQRQGVETIFFKREAFEADVRPDDKAPTRNVFRFRQGGNGLPDRDYYLKPDAKLAEARTAYVAYMAKLMTLAGLPDAEARAQAVMAFETKLATAHWNRIESRDADKTYNKWAIADFPAKAPGFAWQPYLSGLGLAQAGSAIVNQPSAIAGEAKAWGETPLPVLKDHLAVHMLDTYARFLSKPFVDANFAFRGTVLTGAPQIQDRWKRGVGLVSQMVGEEVGQVYTARYFPPESKAAADRLVANIVAAYGQRLKTVAWMAPETRAKALEKLAAFRPMIGYPDTWRDYSTLQVRRDDLLGNVARGYAFEFQRQVNKLAAPVDRGEWDMTPMTINAEADPVRNIILFPAAILQPPFFDAAADPAVNYGGIGVVIGHELSHHFDDQGRKYDPTGTLKDWWTPSDVTRFTAYTDALTKQYDAYEPVPGQHVQGGLTLGENMADLAGLTVSYQGWKISLGGRPAPVLDGLTGDQRFYLGYAQVWRTKYREAALRQQLLTDPHSPGEQRVDEVRNQDGWYKAFDVKPGQALYLQPAARVSVW